MRGPSGDFGVNVVSTVGTISTAEAAGNTFLSNSLHAGAVEPPSDYNLAFDSRFMHLHVMTKNFQSLQDNNRYMDFIAEIAGVDFDILFLTETWRTLADEILDPPGGHRLYLAGGGNHCGVGIAVGQHLLKQLEHVTFHAFSPRVCCLRFRLRTRWFQLIACYLPTSWDSTESVMEVYDLLTLLVSNNDCNKKFFNILGGDFNASIGERRAGDSVCLGHWGLGYRNVRSEMLAR